MSQLAIDKLLNEKDQKIAQLERALAIEAALDRIRTASMKMNKSEELTDVVLTVVQQMQALGIPEMGTGIHIGDKATKEYNSYSVYTSIDGNLEIVTTPTIPIDQSKLTIEANREIEKGNSTFTLIASEEILTEWYEYMENLGQSELVQEYKSMELDKLYFPFAVFHEFSSISTLTTRPLSEDEFNVFRRIAEVFGQSYVRFLDLKKAEAQAKEAQIEVALERVRARSLAMHKSRELHEVITVVHQQLKQVGLNFTTSNIGLPDDNTDHLDWKVWAALDNAQYPTLMHIPYAGNFSIMKDFSIARKSGSSFFTYQLDKKETQRFWKYFFLHHPIEEKRQKEVLQSPGFTLSAAFFKHTVFVVNRYSSIPFKQEENKIISRFGKIFEQTYTRFLDLQTAEAQAREAQIEAALERVRAASMAMHNSEELPSVAEILVNQMTGLGLADIGFAINTVVDEATNKYILYSADPVEKGAKRVMTATPVLEAGDTIAGKLFLERVAKGERNFTIVGGEEQVKEIINFRQNNNNRPSTANVVATLNIDKVYHHFSLFYGKSNIVIITTEPLSQEFQEISKRFADVFGQSYVRFLDLKKAEAQTREAQIEAALERVRAASMAMHKSEDLSKVVNVLFTQFQELNIEIILAYIGIFHLEEHYNETWYSPIKGVKEEAFLLKHSSIPWEETTIKDWKEGKDFSYHSAIGVKATIQFAENLQTLMNTDVFIKMVKELQLERIEATEANHQYGNLCIGQTRKATKEEKNILKRFAKVFEQTYTRFLDLQKAEAQAREAKIEATLERVRAKAMAMQKSEELKEVVNSLFGGLEQLNYNPIDCTILTLNEELGNMECWSTVPTEDGFSAYTYSLIAPEEPFMKKIFQAHRAQNPAWIYHLKGKEKLGFDNTFFEVVQIPEMEAALRSLDSIYANFVFMPQSAIAVFADKPMENEDMALLQRFSTVVNLCYTRFLDLQKAEEQTRQIAKVFNENQRLLHSILPKQIAEQIRKGQQTIVKRFEQVSILFADIVGFTILSDKLSPQKVVNILNGLFSKFDDLTDKYQLEKIKTIGDAYMVASGVPEEKKKHALVLFQFAQEMLIGIQRFNQVHNLTLEIRIGISSGPVVAGVIGKKKFAYDLWGDTVNTAARMEAYGQASCIQLAPPSYELLKNDFVFEKIPDVEIKGKGKMDVYVWMP